MPLDFLVVPGTAQGHTAGQIQTHANGPLVQVGLALGLAGGQTQHGRHRVALQHDNADIRHPFEADAIEQLGGTHTVFDQGLVTVAAQGVNTGNDAGNMMFQLFGGHDAPGGRTEIIFKAIGNHHDTVTARPLGRLDDEIPMGLHHPVQGGNTLLRGDRSVQFRHPDARIQRHLLGL